MPESASRERKVLILDDDLDLRDVLRELYETIGVECLTAGSLAELQARSAEASTCTLAILDINLGRGQPTGVDAYHWLRQQAFDLRIVFLTGHASTDPRVKEASRIAETKILSKPISAQALVGLLNG
jgi:DNA-binding response OmpR family regulator